VEDQLDLAVAEVLGSPWSKHFLRFIFLPCISRDCLFVSFADESTSVQRLETLQHMR